MRNRIIGGIGVLWGGWIMLHWLLSDAPAGASSAYRSGQSGAALFGAAMFCVGLYYFFKKPA